MSESEHASPAGNGEERPLTIAEAAEYLNVSERFIRRLVAERRVPYYKLGKFVRFRRRDLDAYLSSGRVERPEVPLLPSHRVYHAR
jgi:excisionase family DNA binding protein